MLKLIRNLYNRINNFEANTDPDIVKNILAQILSINLAFLSILLAFYIAIVAYFIPQIHQYKLNRELEFNNLLDKMDKIVPGRASSKDYPQYYKNDTVLYGMISYDINIGELHAGHYYLEKEELNMRLLTEEAIKYMNILMPINLICNEPVLGTKLQEHPPYGQRTKISFDKNLYHKIERFIRNFCYSKILTYEDGPKLILYTIEEDVIYDRNWKLTYDEYHIGDSSEIESVKNDRMIFANIYKNFDYILENYCLEITNFNSKIKSYDSIVKTISNELLLFAILYIFLVNILFPIIIQIYKVSRNFALVYLFISFIPYVIIVIQIANYIKGVL